MTEYNEKLGIFDKVDREKSSEVIEFYNTDTVQKLKIIDNLVHRCVDKNIEELLSSPSKLDKFDLPTKQRLQYKDAILENGLKNVKIMVINDKYYSITYEYNNCCVSIAFIGDVAFTITNSPR